MTTTQTQNKAAWLNAIKAPFDIKDAPLEQPKEDRILVKAASIALNPCDWAYQAYGTIYFPNLIYPAIVGEDVAGEVIAVGPNITVFRPGDRVFGLSHSAFQLYPLLRASLAAKIPPSISFQSASVLPLAFTTAAIALFHPTTLHLNLPTSPQTPSNGSTILITGGSTSVGACAIQLAVAAGYTVYTTSSPARTSLCKSLGASKVFDYASPSLTSDIASAFSSVGTTPGACAIGGIDPSVYPGIVTACAAALTSAKRVENKNGRKYIALTMRPPTVELPEGVVAEFARVDELSGDGSGVAEGIWRDYLPAALEKGEFVAKPEAVVVGEGLEAVEGGVGKFMGGKEFGKMVINL